VKRRMKVAFGCHFLATLMLAAFAIVYLLRSEFMPYHSVAVGMSWSEVDPAFQVVILALMRATGGACLAVVVTTLILLFIPFKQGLIWARWAIPAAGLVLSAGALYAMLYVDLNTAATPPWIAPIVGALMMIVGLLLSLGQP